MRYISIDIGSSFVKSALIDTCNHVISDKMKVDQAPKSNHTGGRFEVDGEQMFRKVDTLIDSYTAMYGSDISGIFLSTQMHGFILADKHGKSITPYISWQDERSLEVDPHNGLTFMENLSGIISPKEMENTGVRLKAPLAMCNLFVMLKNGLKIPEGANFCTIGSFMILKMTGRNVCHLSNAGPTGFADVRNKQWNRPLIQKAGAEKLTFPAIINESATCGSYRKNTVDLAVYSDMGDQQVSALGTLPVPETDAIINIGTGAQIGRISRDFVPGEYEIRPFFDNYYLYTVSQLPGGRNIDVLINLCHELACKVTKSSVDVGQIWDVVKNETLSTDSRGLKINANFFNNLNEQPGSIGQINSGNLTVGTLFSALYEDIAESYVRAAGKLFNNTGSIKRIVYSGGVSNRIAAVRYAIEKRFGVDNSSLSMEDEVFIGFYLLALKLENPDYDFMQCGEYLKNNYPVVKE